MEDERESARVLRMPLWPKGVAAVHSRPNPSLGKQIVLKWDDAKGIVIVEAYIAPAQEPAFCPGNTNAKNQQGGRYCPNVRPESSRYGRVVPIILINRRPL